MGDTIFSRPPHGKTCDKAPKLKGTVAGQLVFKKPRNQMSFAEFPGLGNDPVAPVTTTDEMTATIRTVNNFICAVFLPFGTPDSRVVYDLAFA